MKRPLLLGGFMGVGKSTIGRLVAERGGHPFVDLDARVEQRAGKTVSRIFAKDGEAAFRALEGAALDEILADAAPVVVALGGGALLRREVRLKAMDSGVIVTLDAHATTVLERTRGDAGRPLLQDGDPEQRIESLLEQRRSAYAECHSRVATDARAPSELAEEVLAVWRRDPLGVAAGERSYAVDVGAGIAQGEIPRCARGSSLALLVTDQNVAPLHGAAARRALESAVPRAETVVLPPGEEHKSVATLATIWEQALTFGADRKSVLLGFGGGVVTDLTGFAAATWMRGVPWVGVPTTLLAMVDASVGGKTAVDLPGAKNVIGAFWQPSAVLCDVAYLETEPERGYVSALAEVIKTALIGDPALLDLVEREASGARARSRDVLVEMVRRSIRVKARIVSADERESGLRACLNLGHTLGHALEARGGYGHLRHGEAVSLGLVAALRIGERLGKTPSDLTTRATEALRAVGLPTRLDRGDVSEAVHLLGHDKKRAGSTLKFVVARGVGDVELASLDVAELGELARSVADGP